MMDADIVTNLHVINMWLGKNSLARLKEEEPDSEGNLASSGRHRISGDITRGLRQWEAHVFLLQQES